MATHMDKLLYSLCSAFVTVGAVRCISTLDETCPAEVSPCEADMRGKFTLHRVVAVHGEDPREQHDHFIKLAVIRLDAFSLSAPNEDYVRLPKREANRMLT